MKISFATKSEDTAKKFQQELKSKRNLDSELKKTEEGYAVEYSIAEISIADDDKEDGKEKSVCMEDVYAVVSSVYRTVMAEMSYQVGWIQAQIDWINMWKREHSEGHLPPINGAEKMEAALDALGISGDYQIQKPVIYASQGVHIKSFGKNA